MNEPLIQEVPADKFPFQLPQFKIPRFKDNNNDPCDYMRFKDSFISCTQESGMNNKRLFQILKSLLDGKAASLIGSLLDDENSLETALELLDKEFLDKELIIERIISSITSYRDLENSPDLVDEFMSFLRFKCIELKQFQLDFSTENSAGNYLISSIVRNKLPESFLMEMSRRGNRYPKLEVLLDKISEICKVLKGQKASSKKTESLKKTDSYKNNSRSHPYHRSDSNRPSHSNDTSKSTRTFNNRSAESDKGKKPAFCRFCNSKEHASTICNKYTTHKDRKKRAQTIGRCIKCFSADHTECQGEKLSFHCFICKGKGHCPPLCPDYVYRSGTSNKSA